MTGPEAAAKAAEVLALAEDAAFQGDSAGPLCEVADSWRRLAETLDEHPHLETAQASGFVDGLTAQGEALAAQMDGVAQQFTIHVHDACDRARAEAIRQAARRGSFGTRA